MHMRLLNVEVDREGVPLLRRLYEEKVVPALGRVRGCRFAGLMQSVSQPERCLSLTLWDSPADAVEYENSGLYGQLIDESKIFFSQTVEYTIKLSEDLQVEYVPVSNEPVARSYPVAAQSGAEKRGRDLSQALWLRIVSLKILAGKMEEFKELYLTHSIPALRSAPGCRHVYLLENDEASDEVFSITIWDSREHAVAYEQSGVFDRLIGLQRHTLSGHAQGKLLAGEGDPGKSHGTGDVLVEHYTILTGRNFG
jgi:heme-degrading monooxygenase HmoA